ncbi:Hypothetical predicted protein [Paramuricea clavata]|uniref:Uncharacterized protein n=1 Tax=Paramuricea clavata TaxID=317549 RepID=A0A6S7LG15_PARCT|nr:Hypothetical predicted protein [Paramuricea clavata]
MSTENGMGSSRRNNSVAELANTTLVFQTDAAVNRDSLDHTEEQNNTAATMGRTQGSPSTQQSHASCLSDIRESYESQGISAAATSIIVSSWRPSSGKLYQSYNNRWKTYCAAASDTSISQYLGCPRCATSFKDIGPHNRYHVERVNAEVDYANCAGIGSEASIYSIVKY